MVKPPLILIGMVPFQVLVGHPDYEVTGGSVLFKGENLLDMEPEERSLAGLFMSFQSPVEIPGVSNDEFLVMAYNARRRKLGLPELGPLEVCDELIIRTSIIVCWTLIHNTIGIISSWLTTYTLSFL